MPRRGLLLFYLGLAALVLLIGYGLFEGRRLILGPEITILSPQNGSATSSSQVFISGKAYNIAFLNIDGNPAYVDTEGYFSEVISPLPGYSVLTVSASDRFGRVVSKVVDFTVLNYCPLNS